MDEHADERDEMGAIPDNEPGAIPGTAEETPDPEGSPGTAEETPDPEAGSGEGGLTTDDLSGGSDAENENDASDANAHVEVETNVETGTSEPEVNDQTSEELAPGMADDPAYPGSEGAPIEGGDSPETGIAGEPATGDQETTVVEPAGSGDSGGDDAAADANAPENESAEPAPEPPAGTEAGAGGVDSE